ncbi:ABC transporter permease [Devosia sp.]|uniref:ABC transporter permease n=1 Tax=Devosia sp. TaxID=1871048 RepID=UPI002F09AA82
MRRYLPVAATVIRGAAQALGIVFLIFLLCRVVPGDVVDVLGLEGGLTADQAEAMRRELGIDKSLVDQFLDWSGGMLQGEFGRSLRYGVPVSGMLLHALPVSAMLAGGSFAIGLALALVLAVAATSTRSTVLDVAINALNIWSIAAPTFCVGFIGILVFSIWLGWLPVLGGVGMALVIIGLDNAGQLVKPLREELRECVSLPHVRTARAKGLAPMQVAVAHVLPAASPIVLALSGIVLANLVSGTITMEVLFGLPGLGSLALNAIHGRDYPVIMAAITVISVSLVVINTLVDIIARLIDPRMS